MGLLICSLILILVSDIILQPFQVSNSAPAEILSWFVPLFILFSTILVGVFWFSINHCLYSSELMI
jgi:hypothetical protein